jgi:hypothetical protein
VVDLAGRIGSIRFLIRDREILVDAIATIRDVMTTAAEGDDPWILSASTIDISFASTQTGTITLGVNGELADELTHTLRLGLSPASM